EGHFGAQDGVGSTADNLKAAIAGETYEFTHMYPPMAEQANADNHKAKRMFNYALKVEAVHAQLYKLALQAVEQGKDLDVSEIYICPVCGNIEFGKPTENCSVCGLPAAKFIKL
ncbi:MAG TPA: ferritin family protein, partial [Bacteroidota bacterium]|nr:ferritin family protein [Bacteroidota bacterium]